MGETKPAFNKRQPYSLRQLTGLILGTALFLLFLLMPHPDGMTESAQRMAAVAVLMATWWITEAVPIPVTALVPIFMYPNLRIMGTSSVTPNYTNELVFLFLGGFLIAAAMVKWNLHRRIALHTILLIGTGPRRLILGFMIATAFLSMWISNTATAMMMLPIAMAVVSRLSEGALYQGEAGDESEDHVRSNFGLALMLGIAYSASIGGIGTLIGTPPNGVFVGQLARTYSGAAPEVSFSQWMMVGVPVVIVMLPIAWFIVTYVSPSRPLSEFTFGTGGREVIQSELRKLGPMHPGERKTAIVFILTGALWMFRKPINFVFFELPGWGDLFGTPHLWSDASIAVLMGVVLFLLPAEIKTFSFDRTRRHNFVLDWRTAQESVPWGILLLFGGGFALAHGFAASGLSEYIGTRMQFLEGVPLVFVVLIICTVMTFLTEMTSNTATTTLLLPILAVASVDLGEHPFLLMIPATISASCAFMLPVATPPNAIVFGSGWVTIPKMSRTGFALNLIGAIIITTLTFVVITGAFGITLGTIPSWATGN
jgi:sodium-dependent dicarboxylate transporter 2/3/5